MDLVKAVIFVAVLFFLCEELSSIELLCVAAAKSAGVSAQEACN